MKLEFDGNGLSTDMPDTELVCFRPVDLGDWMLGMHELCVYADEDQAERFIRRLIFDVVEADRADWVRVALRDAVAEHGPGSNAPEPFSLIPGGVG